MAKVLTIRQLISKKHSPLRGLPEEWLRSFGELEEGFKMIVWGKSGSGKSNFMMALIKLLACYGKVLYLGLEEGFGATMQRKILMHLDAEKHGNVGFANHEMTLPELRIRLSKRRSPRWVIVDSLQYWEISYADYKKLKEDFPEVGFIFISHAVGKNPDGRTANKIRYDACVKVTVDGFVGFVVSRFGGNKPFIIWPEGAKNHWKTKKYNEFKK